MADQQIQFQPGMSIPEFLRRFGTEAQCVEAVKLARSPDGFRCPRCAAEEDYVVGHGACKLLQCSGRRHQISLTAGNLTEHTKLLLMIWFLGVYVISQAKTELFALLSTLPARPTPRLFRRRQIQRWAEPHRLDRGGPSARTRGSARPPHNASASLPVSSPPAA